MTDAAEAFEGVISLIVTGAVFAAVLLTLTGRDVTVVVDALVSLLPVLVILMVIVAFGARILEELP